MTTPTNEAALEVEVGDIVRARVEVVDPWLRENDQGEIVERGDYLHARVGDRGRVFDVFEDSLMVGFEFSPHLVEVAREDVEVPPTFLS